jgi:hypothetical protein
LIKSSALQEKTSESTGQRSEQRETAQDKTIEEVPESRENLPSTYRTGSCGLTFRAIYSDAET